MLSFKNYFLLNWGHLQNREFRAPGIVHNHSSRVGYEEIDGIDMLCCRRAPLPHFRNLDQVRESLKLETIMNIVGKHIFDKARMFD